MTSTAETTTTTPTTTALEKENQQQTVGEEEEPAKSIDDKAVAPASSPKKRPADEEEKAEEEDKTEEKSINEASKTDNESKSEDVSKATVDITKRPVKRARTAYFIFTHEKRAEVQKQHPGEGVAVVAKALGQMWATLSAEEKQVYQTQAAQERERVAKELKAWQDAGGDASTTTSQNAATAAAAATAPDHLDFPAARIRKICKLDPDVRGLSKESVLLVAKAAELFAAKLGKECVRVAQIQNRRKLLPDDVAQVCASREAFGFLRDDIRDLIKQQVPSAAAGAKGGGSKNAPAGPASSSKPLTAYFPVKS